MPFSLKLFYQPHACFPMPLIQHCQLPVSRPVRAPRHRHYWGGYSLKFCVPNSLVWLTTRTTTITGKKHCYQPMLGRLFQGNGIALFHHNEFILSLKMKFKIFFQIILPMMYSNHCSLRLSVFIRNARNSVSLQLKFINQFWWFPKTHFIGNEQSIWKMFWAKNALKRVPELRANCRWKWAMPIYRKNVPCIRWSEGNEIQKSMGNFSRWTATVARHGYIKPNIKHTAGKQGAINIHRHDPINVGDFTSAVPIFWGAETMCWHQRHPVN